MSKKPLTELRDADIRRVDAVKGAANGTRFLIAKASAGEAGIVSPEEVRDLIADPAIGEDQYLGVAGEVIKAEMSSAETNDLPDSQFAFIEPGGSKDSEGKTTPRSLRHFPIGDEAHVRNALARLSSSPFESQARPKVEAAARRMGIGEPVEKESQMTAPADQVPAGAAVAPNVDASPPDEVQKDARAILKQAERDRRVAKLEKKVAKAKSAAAPPAEAEPDSDDAAVEKIAPPVSLKKAKAAAKAARLEKRAARDRIAVAKAQATLAKIGRRNSTTDQGHVDAIDDHAAALGASAHQNTTGTPVTLEKGSDDLVAGAIEIIKEAIGPLFGEKLEAIRGDLTQMSGQLATIAKTSLPGGPRVVLERDGSLVAAPDGQPGLTFEQVALGKAAERYPVGSVQRETLEKVAATSAIKDLMQARDNR